ncbi:acyl-CoA dehydrogenase [Helicobacter saguini]|uniref:Acyl-CoA dehydrogenase n=1 Tax=Helicobacter saguini TaxID=1548018 RepID=A0A347VX55_9HELI|nr:acyl-CoA dehydrogenase family protein [Helicobacter saguini]MWV61767.1 acyl-CoA dehydrogenase [Helicobacter saguini]MWV67560.1 acyl-CoA dehydrogenase [Helicobacter saguini]MWV69911.1 acyl-CoA dehydrogenase [Helicobacter saguini]MWV72874.1 acyl-CoA dehydrogenase [Helicobacter saguini]TLD93230.1 acyl-CoA dehydrogenase [Helicobacter saguini]
METKISKKLQNVIDSSLKVQLDSIHNDGIYPRDTLQEMAKIGAFSFFLESGKDGLLDSILTIAQIGQTCGNTAFCAWCQSVLAWYLFRTKNENVKAEFFSKVSSGEILGGTGLSNPMKSYAGFENMLLNAKKVDGGYVLNGMLPWVSNLESNHILGVVAKLDKPYNVAGIVLCDPQNASVKLKDTHFIALDGSATKSVILSDYFMPNAHVLGLPAESFLLSVTSGFLLLQMGMALGSINLSLDLIKKSNVKKGVLNNFLPLNESKLTALRDDFLRELSDLATNFRTCDSGYLRSILELRLKASRLTLDAAQTAMLHAGSSGYLAHSSQEKLLLESYFVAIISPSIRHILSELDSIDKGNGAAKRWKDTAMNFRE